MLNNEQIFRVMWLAASSMTDYQLDKIQQIDRFHLVSRAQAIYAVEKLIHPCKHGCNRLCDCPDCLKEIEDELGGPAPCGVS